MISCPNCGQSNCAFDLRRGDAEWWECFDCHYRFCLTFLREASRSDSDRPVAWS